jgi:O-antigen ligase
MNRFIVIICFYLPLVISCLNLQALISQFISPSIAQLVAYLNLILIIIGVFLFRKNIKTLSTTNKLWFIFYILYYSFGILASGISGFQTSIIATLVPVIYFTGFYFLLSNREQFKIFFKVITICFVISAFVTILFLKLNLNIKAGGVHDWDLDRAGGITGDANAAAHTSLFAFILFNQLYKPSKYIFRILKILILLMIFYSLFLTFSTTGLFVFTIIFFLTNYKFFTGIKLILFIAVIPLFYAGIFAVQSQAQNLDFSIAQTDKINNIVNLLTLNFEEVDNSGRGDLLENGLYYLYKNPILGNGIDFSLEMRTHNTYAGIWIDAGVFTFLFFLFMLANYFLKTFTLNTQLRFFGMSILIVLSIFMVSLQSVINQPYLIVLFVFVGYLIDHQRLDRGDSEISHES